MTNDQNDGIHLWVLPFVPCTFSKRTCFLSVSFLCLLFLSFICCLLIFPSFMMKKIFTHLAFFIMFCLHFEKNEKCLSHVLESITLVSPLSNCNFLSNSLPFYSFFKSFFISSLVAVGYQKSLKLIVVCPSCWTCHI